jgi:glycosyltransferase involved in cell wall biosynthesis
MRPLEKRGVPIVHALHDFKPWCTNRLLYAHGAPCTLCRGGAHWHAAATSCVQGSRGKSIVGSVEAYLHDAIGAYRAVRLWVAPSGFARDLAVASGARADAVRVLAHGVEESPAQPRPADLPERYVLFMARVAVEKGVHALPAIAARIAPVPLVIAGGGPLSDWLAAQRVPNLRMLGHVADGRLAALRAHADVVISPSLFHEAFGYSVAEALLDARPVVASRIGALPELVEHEVTGLLATPGDAASQAEATRRALDDPHAAAWGRAGRERVRRIGDVDAHVRGLLAIYEEARRG